MKNSTLVSAVVAMFSFSMVNAQNLIKDGDFESVTEIKFTENGNLSECPAGSWAFMDKNNTPAQSSVTIENDGDMQGGFVKIVNGPVSYSWFKVWLQQYTEEAAKPETYVLTFDCKASAKATVSSYIEVASNKYALIQGFDKDATPGASGARTNFAVTTEWATYTAEYDMSQYCNNVNSPTSQGDKYVVGETTEDELSSVKLMLNSLVNGLTYYIDNVSLAPKNDNTTSIDKSENKMRLYSGNRSIIAEGVSGIVNIYNINGIQVASEMTINGSLKISAAPGIYIVKTETAVSKVIVK